MLLRVLALVVTLAPFSANGERACRDDLDEADGYIIRSVKAEGRWVPRIKWPIKPGDRYSNAGIERALKAVQEALHTEDRQQFEIQNLGALGVLYISPCLLVDGREVDVIIRPRSLRLDLIEVGGNVLPVPRSALATFYAAVPDPILALNPIFGAYQDKKYGFAPTAGIDGNLLNLSKTTSSSAAQAPRLDLVATGRKSIENPFYDADLRLSFSTLRAHGTLDRLSLEAAYHGTREPQGDSSLRRQAGEIGVGVRLRPGWGLAQTVSLDGSYRFSENRFTANGDRTSTGEQSTQLRLLVDGRAGDAFLRAGLWAEAGFPDRGSNYGRIAALAAVQKEFLLRKNQTIGVEMVVGGGSAWSAPAYAEFYGGNSNRNFLYESLGSPSLAAFPKGPSLRSLGEGQTLAQGTNENRGSSRYWHLNLNVSLPIRGLSFPLIPDEEIKPGVSLKQFLKNKARDPISYLAAELEDQGLSPKEAMAKAEATYSDVTSAVDFIADRANVYALKPLLLFDLAGEDGSGAGHRVEAAVGGGLQLTIVTAKMEAGYMHSITGSDSGNLFARIVFQNIF